MGINPGPPELERHRVVRLSCTPALATRPRDHQQFHPQLQTA
jgi:hypothetical protein